MIAESSLVQVRIVLVVARCLERIGLRTLLEAQPGWVVLADCPTVVGAWQAVCDHRPDLIIVSSDLGETKFRRLVVELLSLAPSSKVLPLISLSQHASAQDLRSVGVHGCLIRDSSLDEFSSTIRRLLLGQGSWCFDPVNLPSSPRPDSVDPSISGEPRTLPSVLTRRHWSILGHVALGKTNRQIADEFHLSPFTIRNSLASIFLRLGVQNRTSAIFAAQKLLGEVCLTDASVLDDDPSEGLDSDNPLVA